MFSLDDTIVAVSTPVGEGGIGIVRLSGPQAPWILGRLFVAGRPKDWQAEGSAAASSLASGRAFQPFRLHYGHIVDPAGGEVIDEVLAVHMPAPRTYTRQDVVEINAHGGVVAVRRILGLCLALGARLAERGEFTLRAFLNGRLDLAQAEAVLDVVRAKTDRALQTAMGQLAGHLSGQVGPVRDRLLHCLAHLEASIDFEDEMSGLDRDVAADLDAAAADLESILAGAGRGIIYRHGVRVAIIGRPNVGKSSLLNRLLRTSRAIVTDVPGTTRDTLEETLNLQGVPIVVVDTAGIAASDDPVGRLGVERSREALAQSDMALLVLDASEPPAIADYDIAALVGTKPAIAVLNKIDLLATPDPQHAAQGVEGAALAERAMRLYTAWSLDNWPMVPISTLTGEGLETLEKAIVDIVLSGQAAAADVPLVSNPRHEDVLRRVLGQVHAARETWQAGLPADLIAIDLAAAVQALGEITGHTAGEELLATIFNDFCIGK